MKDVLAFVGGLFLLGGCLFLLTRGLGPADTSEPLVPQVQFSSPESGGTCPVTIGGECYVPRSSCKISTAPAQR